MDNREALFALLQEIQKISYNASRLQTVVNKKFIPSLISSKDLIDKMGQENITIPTNLSSHDGIQFSLYVLNILNTLPISYLGLRGEGIQIFGALKALIKGANQVNNFTRFIDHRENLHGFADNSELMHIAENPNPGRNREIKQIDIEIRGQKPNEFLTKKPSTLQLFADGVACLLSVSIFILTIVDSVNQVNSLNDDIKELEALYKKAEKNIQSLASKNVELLSTVHTFVDQLHLNILLCYNMGIYFDTTSQVPIIPKSLLQQQEKLYNSSFWNYLQIFQKEAEKTTSIKDTTAMLKKFNEKLKSDAQGEFFDDIKQSSKALEQWLSIIEIETGKQDDTMQALLTSVALIRAYMKQNLEVKSIQKQLLGVLNQLYPQLYKDESKLTLDSVLSIIASQTDEVSYKGNDLTKYKPKKQEVRALTMRINNNQIKKKKGHGFMLAAPIPMLKSDSNELQASQVQKQIDDQRKQLRNFVLRLIEFRDTTLKSISAPTPGILDFLPGMGSKIAYMQDLKRFNETKGRAYEIAKLNEHVSEQLIGLLDDIYDYVQPTVLLGKVIPFFKNWLQLCLVVISLQNVDLSLEYDHTLEQVFEGVQKVLNFASLITMAVPEVSIPLAVLSAIVGSISRKFAFADQMEAIDHASDQLQAQYRNLQDSKQDVSSNLKDLQTNWSNAKYFSELLSGSSIPEDKLIIIQTLVTVQETLIPEYNIYNALNTSLTSWEQFSQTVKLMDDGKIIGNLTKQQLYLVLWASDHINIEELEVFLSQNNIGVSPQQATQIVKGLKWAHIYDEKQKQRKDTKYTPQDLKFANKNDQFNNNFGFNWRWLSRNKYGYRVVTVEDGGVELSSSEKLIPANLFSDDPQFIQGLANPQFGWRNFTMDNGRSFKCISIEEHPGQPNLKETDVLIHPSQFAWMDDNLEQGLKWKNVVFNWRSFKRDDHSFRLLTLEPERV